MTNDKGKKTIDDIKKKEKKNGAETFKNSAKASRSTLTYYQQYTSLRWIEVIHTTWTYKETG